MRIALQIWFLVARHYGMLYSATLIQSIFIILIYGLVNQKWSHQFCLVYVDVKYL